MPTTSAGSCGRAHAKRGFARQGQSHRAIARQLGVHRKTVKVWLALEPPAEVPNELVRDWHDRRLPTADTMRRHIREAKHAQVRELAEQGHSYCAIARQVGIHRVTVSKWLNHAEVDDPAQHPTAPAESTADVETPAALSSSQPPLQVARRFVLEWYLLWHDANGQRRTLEDARDRFSTWSSDASYAAVAPLRRVQERMTAEFERLSHFLRNPRWEATNNGAERAGRAFRHRQAPHFNLRTETTIEGAIVVMACQRKAAATTHRQREIARCSRGRKPHQQMEVCAVM